VIVAEPVLLQCPFPGGDGFGAFDHGVDGLDVVAVALERPLPDHAPVPGLLPGAHGAGGLQGLPVVEGVAVTLQVIGQVIGRLAGLRADDEPEPRVLQPEQVRRGEHSGVGDHDDLAGVRVLVPEAGQDRHDGLGLGLVALEQVHGQREPRAVGEQPDRHLRIDPALLGHADLAQPVLARGLEVERGQVVEDQREPAPAGGVGVAGIRDGVAVVPLDDPSQAALRGGPRRGGNANLGQHPHGVDLAGRLDDPPQHQRPERFVAHRGEPQCVIDRAECVPQDQRAGGLHHRAPRPVGRRRGVQVQFQRLLARVPTFPSGVQQQRQGRVVVSRADVVDPDDVPAALVHDLHRRRARGGLHPAHERAHWARLAPRLVTTSRHETAAHKPATPMITPQ